MLGTGVADNCGIRRTAASLRPLPVEFVTSDMKPYYSVDIAIRILIRVRVAARTDIDGIREKLPYKQNQERVYRGISEIVLVIDALEPRGQRHLGPRLGSIDIIPFHHPMMYVMQMVRYLPGEIRGPEYGVRDLKRRRSGEQDLHVDASLT